MVEGRVFAVVTLVHIHSGLQQDGDNGGVAGEGDEVEERYSERGLTHRSARTSLPAAMQPATISAVANAKKAPVPQRSQATGSAVFPEPSSAAGNDLRRFRPAVA